MRWELDFLPDVSMAILLVFIAEARQCDGLTEGELLQEAEGEFLTVALDRCIADVERPAIKQLTSISSGELAPGDLPRLKSPQKFFARSQAWHPDVIAIGWKCVAVKAGRKQAQPVPSLYFRVDGFGLYHSRTRKILANRQ